MTMTRPAAKGAPLMLMASAENLPPGSLEACGAPEGTPLMLRGLAGYAKTDSAKTGVAEIAPCILKRLTGGIPCSLVPQPGSAASPMLSLLLLALRCPTSLPLFGVKWLARGVFSCPWCERAEEKKVDGLLLAAVVGCDSATTGFL